MTPAGRAERLEAVEQADTLEMRPGLVLGRYRLGERLGEGGFGTVWLAHDERLHRAVALKRIPIEPGTGTERAEREALAAARLGHPGIVALYEAGHDGHAFYLASELVRGRTLAQLEADGALSDRDVVRIGAALCGALEHAHARGVVHRDVKPGNVIVADDGTVKLTDFGIARLADSSTLTLTGDVVGTLAYMAPEQAEGRRVTGAADLYALALVLYEALTGTNPVRAEGAAATARRVGMRLPPLGRVRRDLPRALCLALDRALEPEPRERGTLEDLRLALVAAEHRVEDVPGPIEGAPAAEIQVRTPRTRAWGRAARERTWLQPAPGAAPPPRPAPAGGFAAPAPAPAREAPPPQGAVAAPAPADAERAPSGLLERLLAGVAAGALAWWCTSELPVILPEGAEPAAIGAGVALAVAVLPRLAWLAAAVALVASAETDRAALFLAAAVVPVVLLLPRAGWLWSLPAAAAALAPAGLAGAYPALAGQPRAWHARAALGALGAVWYAVVGEVLEREPDLAVLSEPELYALAGLWAAAAVALPLLVRGRSAGPDVLGALAWAAALAVATPLAVPGLAGEAVAGAAVGAALAIALSAVRAGRRDH